MMHQSDVNARPMAEVHCHTNNQDLISEKLRGEKDIGPIYKFMASPKMGPGAIVSTLQTGYPRIHALGQDKGQGMRPRAATCHHSSEIGLPA
jgi:hypothetical protein